METKCEVMCEELMRLIDDWEKRGANKKSIISTLMTARWLID